MSAIEASIVLVQWKGVLHAQPGVTRTKAEALTRAGECLAMLRGGTPFREVVAVCSDEPGAVERAGRMGSFTRERLVKPFTDAAFALCVDEVSAPVETPFGYTIILRTK